MKCKHCEHSIEIRNASGFCDHLYYPDNCKICKAKIAPKTKGWEEKFDEKFGHEIVRLSTFQKSIPRLKSFISKVEEQAKAEGWKDGMNDASHDVEIETRAKVVKEVLEMVEEVTDKQRWAGAPKALNTLKDQIKKKYEIPL